MYKGGRPNAVAKAMNRFSTWTNALGLTSRWMVNLEVTGRKSGKTISQPMVMVKINGERYLVSMLGGDVQWIKNLRAANNEAVIYTSGRERVVLEDVPVAQRAPIIKEYLKHAPGARPHIPVDRHAPLADFERIAPDIPVFRVINAEQA
ncbi:MAG: nitroreductase family deazaflavin-dependent oxidoreductase [Anaerolineae bacterium]|nr:nitroreductase family deazaflavin-dependent oxidoreductase [Anaerolineae bacterium]